MPLYFSSFVLGQQRQGLNLPLPDLIVAVLLSPLIWFVAEIISYFY